MSRGGRHTPTPDTERKCLVTGEVQPKAGLVRFVTGPDGSVVPDILGRLPGRGYYVSSQRAHIETALRKKLFARGAKTAVTTPPDLTQMIEQGLANRVIELISLARKAGLAIAGYEKVRDWLLKDTAVALLQAHDGSERGKSKLRPPDGDNTYFTALSGNELGLAFGRESAIHVALAAGGLTERIVQELSRLSGLRDMHDGNTAVGKEKTA